MSDQTPGHGSAPGQPGQPGYGPQGGYGPDAGAQPGYGPDAGTGYGAQPGYGADPGYAAGQPGYPPAEPPPRGSRRGLLIGAGAAVLAVVAGAAVWATTTLSGGGRQPDELAPKSTFAYVKVDLDPAANQKLAARSYFEKFPALRGRTGDTDNVFEDVLASLIRDEDVDYNRDLKPWFDKRAAVAAFRGAGGQPQVVGVLRSKDDERARAALDRIVAEAQRDGETVAYQLTRGYAVVGEPPAVSEAVRLTEKESLSDNEFYRDDVDRLEGDQVAVAWANIGEAFDAVKSAVPFLGMVPNLVTDQVKGRFVAGLRLTGDYAEVQGVTVGVDQRRVPKVTAATDLLTALPSDTAAAVSLSGLAAGTTQADSFFDLDDLAGQYLQGSGLSFTKDIAPTLGDQTVFAVARAADEGDPSAGLVTKPSSTETAERTGQQVATLLQFFGLEPSVKVSGDRFVLATDEAYATRLTAGDGGLGAAPRFTKAVGDLKDAAAVGYVDLTAVPSRIARTRDVPAGLAAVGVVSGTRDEAQFFRLRLVAE